MLISRYLGHGIASSGRYILRRILVYKIRCCSVTSTLTLLWNSPESSGCNSTLSQTRQSPDCICRYPRSNYKLQQYVTGVTWSYRGYWHKTCCNRSWLKDLRHIHSHYGASIEYHIISSVRVILLVITSLINSCSQLKPVHKGKIQFHNFCAKHHILGLFQEKIVNCEVF